MAYTRTPLESSLPTARKKGGFFRTMLLLATMIGVYCIYSIYMVRDISVPAKNFSVTKGDTLYSLRSKLSIDVADWRYRGYLRWFAPEVALQSGTYSIGSGATVYSVFSESLKTPSTKDITITILPGWTVYDIDAYLQSFGLIGSGEVAHIDAKTFAKLQSQYPFLAGSNGSLEGFLYPDTYRVRAEMGLTSILSKLLGNFQTKIGSKYPSLSSKELYKTLILASIVEKEERSNDNRKIVAGILSKRLAEKMLIGADATVCYPYEILYRDCTPAFIVEHLDEKTAYNTRKVLGLPPTPISSVTFSSFSAAASPEASEYYYYLHDSDGVIHYGRTLEEHARNKARFLSK